jgi:hypothetical protein
MVKSQVIVWRDQGKIDQVSDTESDTEVPEPRIMRPTYLPMSIAVSWRD